MLNPAPMDLLLYISGRTGVKIETETTHHVQLDRPLYFSGGPAESPRNFRCELPCCFFERSHFNWSHVGRESTVGLDQGQVFGIAFVVQLHPWPHHDKPILGQQNRKRGCFVVCHLWDHANRAFVVEFNVFLVS
jgi:hypothetical protein